MKVSIKSIINYIAVFTVFSNAFSIYADVSELRIAYPIIFLLSLLMLPFLKDINLNKAFLSVFSVLCIFSLYNIYRGNNTLILFAKQLIGIFTSAVFFYLLIKFNNYDVKKLFRIYLNIAYIVALIGIIQEVSFLLNFKPGYDYSFLLPNWEATQSLGTPFLRVNSILPEPAHFCGAIMPAFFVSLTTFTKYNAGFLDRWKSIIIMLSFVFSFSTVGYIGVFFSILILFYNWNKLRYIILSCLIVSAIFFLLYNYIYEFSTRTASVVGVLRAETEIEEADLSTFALMSNARVAYNTFMENPLIGAGLGSHELSYDKYIDIVIDSEKIQYILNRKDAASLFLRLISETGLFGLSFFFIFLWKFYLRNKEDQSNYLWIINNAILCMFFIRLVRYGHYFTEGFFLFFWLYYFSKKQSCEMLNKFGMRESNVTD